jgi:hypothetical protein
LDRMNRRDRMKKENRRFGQDEQERQEKRE